MTQQQPMSGEPDKHTARADNSPDRGGGFDAAYKQIRAWSRTGLGRIVIVVLLYLGVSYWMKSMSNEEGYANIRGGLLVSDGKYDEAIAEFNKSIKLAPNWYQPYMGRGNAYRLKHDYDQALADLNKSIELKSDYAESHYDRGLVWRAKGDNARAFADFGSAVDLDPTGAVGAEAAVERAKLHREQKVFELALADLTRAITYQSKPTWLLERASLNLFDLNRPLQAADDFAAAAREAIKYRERVNLLNSAAGENQRQQAPDMMDYRVPFNPGAYYALLWAHYARVHAGQGDGKEMAELVDALTAPIRKNIFINDPLHATDNAAVLATALKPWPGEIYLMFLGKSTPKAVRAKAKEAADTAVRRRRQCDADFYLAIFDLQKHDVAGALPLLHAVAAGCPSESQEAQFAKVELKQLGS